MTRHDWTATPCARLLAQGVDYWFGPESIGRGIVEEPAAEKELRVARAKAECATCPLQAECLELGTGEEGIWGGRTDEERTPAACGDAAGTMRGVSRHRKARQPTCDQCRPAKQADDLQRWHAKKAAA